MRRLLLTVVSGSMVLACAYGVSDEVIVPSAGPDAAVGTRDSGPVLDARPSAKDATTDHAVLDAPSDAGDPDVADPDAADSGGVGSVWTTAKCDGVISVGEYGGLQNELVTGTGQRWLAAWDAQNLYVAVEGANVGEGVVIYVGHGLLGGSTQGQPYDSTMASTLPFSANAVAYAKASYTEVRTASKNVWSKTGSVTACAGGNGTTREVVMPWATLGANGLPAAFRIATYVTSANGWVYGQLPTNNPSGFVGMNATFPHDYWVQSTSNGGGSFPFSFVE
jgi:hypothetical protein